MAELDPRHPCVRHDCHRCCLATEMTLTAEDVRRMSALGYRGYYMEAPDGFLQLVNVDGHCFFLKGGHCSIYDHRPHGCRLYPLILDTDTWEVELHDYCPNRGEFAFGKEEREALRELIRLQEAEREMRTAGRRRVTAPCPGRQGGV